MSAFQRFWTDEDGAAILYFLIAIPAFMGLSLLAIDVGRGNNLHYDLQRAVDSLALTAARELDGSPGARARATARLSGELTNATRFNDGPDVVLSFAGASILAPRFLKDLPANDDAPITNANLAGNDAEARFVEVTAIPQNYTALFPVSYIAGSETVAVSATAVAGYGSTVCQFTPMFICNPFENDQQGRTIYSLLDSNVFQHKPMITLRQQGGNQGQPFPGNFGFLQIPVGNSGAAAIREAFANMFPLTCFSSAEVTTKPGFAATITDAINVRFDIFDGPMQQAKNGPNAGDYAPARNVRKGYGPSGQGQGGNKCNWVPQTDPTRFMGLPRDNCAAGGCTTMQGGELGNGLWDIDGYWATNFGGSPPNGWSNTNLPPSRHAVYEWELANNLVPVNSVGGENGTPGCNSAAPTDPSIDRRLVYAAIVNCTAEAPAAGQEDVRPIAFGSMFLTEALEKGGSQLPNERDNQSIRVELVDLTGPQGNGSLNNFVRDEPQLYR